MPRLTAPLCRAVVAAGVAVAASAGAAAPGADEPAPIPARLDAFGVFVLEEGAPPAWPGPGVRALLGRHGRLASGAPGASVSVRGADGAWERRTLRFEPTAESFAGDWRRAVTDDAASRVRGGSGGAVASRVDESLVPAPDAGRETRTWRPDVRCPVPPVIATPGGSRFPTPERGADLAAWAPPGMLFFRFRSPEAAFRMADIADRIAGRLLAAAGDGRDAGTLRWALHDLVLPAMWNANPGGEKGVTETALIVGDWTGGRPQIAVIFRIRDAELHRMDTEAGLAYAALPAHVWRPEDDPDPASRAPRNHRRTTGDVEIVATTAEMLSRIAVPSRPTLIHDSSWKAVRTEPPGPSEAMFAFSDPESRARLLGPGVLSRDAWLRGMRWGTGVVDVLRRWAGFTDPVLVWPAPSRDPGILSAFVSAVVTTDAKGALVTVTFTDHESAETARTALVAITEPSGDGRAVCAANRREILPLARTERDAKDLAERCFVVFGWKPACPCGGRYSAHPVTSEVACSEHGTDAAPAPSPRPAKPLARDLVRDGCDVRFLVPVEWSRQ